MLISAIRTCAPVGIGVNDAASSLCLCALDGDAASFLRLVCALDGDSAMFPMSHILRCGLNGVAASSQCRLVCSLHISIGFQSFALFWC